MSIRVLIVDDDPALLQMLRSVLGSRFNVVGAVTDGGTALAQYDDLRPDVVVLDIMMSGAEDGLTTLRKLRAHDAQARVVMCSALSNREVMNEAFHEGAWDFIIKPFTLERIRDAIERAAPVAPPAEVSGEIPGAEEPVG